MSTDAELQAAWRAATGTAGMFNEDLHAYLDTLSIPQGQINERVLAWQKGLNPAIQTISAAWWAMHNASGLLLDGISAPVQMALSLRRVKIAYTGPAIRVRRSSDNAEQDINFTVTDDLDILALATFAGVGSAFVTVWYDQSGNAYNATQTTAALQPRIVNAGVLETFGTKYGLRWVLASLNVMSFPGAAGQSGSGDSNTFVCGNASSSFATEHLVFYGTNATSQTRGIFKNTSRLVASSVGFGTSPNAGDARAQFVAMQVCAGLLHSIRYNGTSGGTQSTTRNTILTAGFLGANIDGIATFDGKMTEIFLYRTDLPLAEKQLIERNQGTYYGITVA